MASSGRKPLNVQGAQAVERAIALVRLVAAHPEAGARQADLIRLSGLTAPTLHRLLRTLERNGYVERNQATGRYFLGPEIHALGTAASNRFNLLRASGAAVARLTGATSDSVLLSGRIFWHVICLARDEGSYPIRSQIMRVGQRAPLGTTAAGIAILATLADDEISAALDTNAEEIAARWPEFTRPVTLDLVAQTRNRGFALNPGLVIPGSWAIAVGICGADGSCVGALTVSAIEQRFDDLHQSKVVAALRQEASRVEQRLLKPTANVQRPA